VHPYGDPGYDWLDMNLARVRSPELRPSTNTSIGRVVVTDLQQRLIQKTDRSGFIENEAFSELRRFAQDALEWMAAARLSEREARRIEERARAPQVVAQAKATLTHTIESLPPEDRHALQAAVGRLDAAREQEARTLREDLQLYRTLGTVGTTTAVFAHEAAKPVTQIEMMADDDRATRTRGVGREIRYLPGEPGLQYIAVRSGFEEFRGLAAALAGAGEAAHRPHRRACRRPRYA